MKSGMGRLTQREQSWTMSLLETCLHLLTPTLQCVCTTQSYLPSDRGPLKQGFPPSKDILFNPHTTDPPLQIKLKNTVAQTM